MRFGRSLRFIVCVGATIAGAASTAPACAQTRDELARELAETQAALARLQESVARLEARLDEQDSLKVTELEERVNELETIATDVDESIGSRSLVSSFDAASFDVGGFFDSAVTGVIGEDRSDFSFNRQTFELLAKARFSERWELFAAQAFVREAPLEFADAQMRRAPTFGDNNSPVAADTVIAWGQYHQSDLLNVQFGRFITPQGIVNIEHFPASLLDSAQPQFLRPFPGQTIFANFTNGLNVYGSTYMNGGNSLSYAVYGGVWAGNSSVPAFGGRVAYALADAGLTIGINGSSGDRASEIAGDRFYAGGIDILFDHGPFLWKSELFATDEGAGGDRLAYYSQPAIRLKDNLFFFYRYDFLDTGAVGGETVEHASGIVFNPITNVRLRAIYRNRRFHDDSGVDAATLNLLEFATTINF